MRLIVRYIVAGCSLALFVAAAASAQAIDIQQKVQEVLRGITNWGPAMNSAGVSVHAIPFKREAVPANATPADRPNSPMILCTR
ncbi:MAG TPA: hypothetical protein VIC32_06385, partial [Terriglobales bacterium]